jgi:hypothetical protein
MSSSSAGTTATEDARFGDSIISNSWYKGITCVLKKVEMQIGNVGGDYADLYFCNGVLVGMCKTGFWS